MKDKAISRAKMQIMHMKNTVFYATILFSLKLIWDESRETAATNGTDLIINPIWFLDLSEPKRIGLVLHEVLHVALSHMTRRGDRNPRVWNIAADHVINLTLLKAGYELPDGGLWDSRFKGKSTEQVYTILIDEVHEDEANGGLGADGMAIPGGMDIDCPVEEKDIEVVEKAVAGIVQNAKIIADGASQMAGNAHNEALVQMQKVLNPELPWGVILMNYLTGIAKNDFTWKRPNRRYMPDYYLPTAYSENLGVIAEAVDASTSVEDREFASFIAATIDLQETMTPEKITVLTFDTKIRDVQEILPDTNILEELEFHGRGGTNIQPVLQWAQDNNPVVLLVFTDGDFRWPDKKYWPDCPVVWLIHNDKHEGFKAPFGEVIFYKI